MPQAETPETFHHYRILLREDGSLWELGRGAMGVTYKAEDTNLRTVVALKVINSLFLHDQHARERFIREARAAASLRHRNVAAVHHLGQDEQSYFYAMEFIDGATVESVVEERGPLPWRVALTYVLQVTRALMAAHEKQLVHRDIKPANLMLVAEAGEDDAVIKVIDFGLAKSLVEAKGSLVNVSGSGFVGTPLFASPEQCEEIAPDIRSDIYSLGVVFWYMLTGKPVFGGPLGKIFAQHISAEPPWQLLPAGLPAGVLALLRKMLAKDRSARPQTPAELRHQIESCLRDEATTPAENWIVKSSALPFATLPGPAPQSTLATAAAANSLGAPQAPSPPTVLVPPGSPPPHALAPTYDEQVASSPSGGIARNPRLKWTWIVASLLIVTGALVAMVLANHSTRTAPPGAAAKTASSAAAPTFPADAARQQQLAGWFAQARAAVMAANFSDAVTAYSQVLELDPNSLEAMDERGSALDFLGDVDKAKSDYTRAVAAVATTPRAHFFRADACDSLHKADDAQKEFLAAAPLEARDAFDYYLRGRVDAGTSKYADALKDFSEAVRLYPRASLAFFNRGYTNLAIGSFDDALKDFSESIRLSPSFAEALVGRGSAYNHLKRFDDATKDCTEAIRLSPRLALAYDIRAGAYFNLERFPDAIKDCTEAMRLDPDLTDAVSTRGVVFNQIQDYQEAIDDFTRAIQLDPQSAAAFNGRAFAYNGMRFYKKAVDDCTKAIRLNPQSAAAFRNRGIANSAMLKYNQAVEDCTEAIRLDPQDAEAYYTRGDAYGHLQNYDLTVQDCTRAIELNRRDAMSYYDRGYAQLLRNKYNESVKDLTEAIRLQPRFADAFFNRALAYEALGNKIAAQKDRATAKRLSAD